ncbi:MAG: putative Ig domain-containing protein [Isosphaeraceae bacterium]
MGSTRQRSDRPDSVRRRQSHTPEQLESRLVLSAALPDFLSLYTPSDLYVTNPITNQRIPISARDLMQHNNPNSSILSNQGKIVSGTDRAGDQWTITVHGPGQVIVTDTTPNDGALDDDIATIQIINSSLQSTYVTGTVIASPRVLTSGQVLFDRLIANSGVRSIVLNGFDLSDNVTPAVEQTPGIFLYGGVQTLKFNDIDAIIDTASSGNPTVTGSLPSGVSGTVDQAPAITSADDAAFTVGQFGSFTITTTGFTPPATLTETGTLPTGVTFVDNGNGTATLAGTPQEGTLGTYSLTFTAANGISPSATQSFTLTVNPQYQIVIGDPSTPLKVKPSIYLDSINNSVFDSTSTTIPTAPITTPSVLFSINGVVQNFDVVSMTQSPIPPNYIAQSQNGTVKEWTGVPQSGPIPAGYQFQYNVVGTTGRTSLQALAVNHLNVVGKATNFTAQRATTPFGSSLSGLKYIRRATFGGTADAVALDVNGPIGRLTFKRGLGDPTGVTNATETVANTNPNLTPTTVYLPATSYGVPLGSEGYPAHGLLGGVITAKKIKSLKVGPANYTTLTAQNPNFIITGSTRTATSYMVNPGTALTNAAITTQGSIGHVTVTGNQLNSEIKTGFDYQSYLAGLEGTREASRIARLTQRGDLVSSVDSATFRPALNTTTGQYVYSTTTGIAGKGSITGTSTAALGHGIDAASYSKVTIAGSAYNTGGRTALGNYGAGFFARRIKGKLPKSNG